MVPCSRGDLFGRLSVLTLKRERIAEADAPGHVRREREPLLEAMGDRARYPAEFGPRLDDLAAAGDLLWTTEDDIRACERAGGFSGGFAALARDVCEEDDRRAASERRIDLSPGSVTVGERTFTSAPSADA